VKSIKPLAKPNVKIFAKILSAALTLLTLFTLCGAVFSQTAAASGSENTAGAEVAATARADAAATARAEVVATAEVATARLAAWESHPLLFWSVIAAGAFLVLLTAVVVAMVRSREQLSLYSRTLFENDPNICFMFDDKFKVIDCNDALVSTFGLKDKTEAIERFFEVASSMVLPVQDSGRPAVPIIKRLIDAKANGEARSQSTLSSNGKTIILDIRYIRIPKGNSFVIACYGTDITALRQSIKEKQNALGILERQEMLLTKLNEVAVLLMSKALKEDWRMSVAHALKIAREATGADRVSFWRNEEEDGVAYARRIAAVGFDYGDKFDQRLDYETFLPDWRGEGVEEKFISADTVSLPYKELAKWLKDSTGTLSVTIVPIVLEGNFWGIFALMFNSPGKTLPLAELQIFRQAGLVCAATVVSCERNRQLVDALSSERQARTEAEAVKAEDNEV